MIRSYRREDAASLAQVYTALHPGRPLRAAGFHAYVAAALPGHAWTIADEQPFGYAVVFAVPGLPHVVDLACGIAPDRQRQGFGSRLLARVLDDLRGTAVSQVACQVPSLESAAALFLRHNGFVLEHEEWQLRLADLATAPLPQPQPGVAIGTWPRREAIPLLQVLYEQSFAGLPWAQPYSAAEIAATLNQPADLLVLEVAGVPGGFAWLRLEEEGALGVIEPLGVAREHQGRGYGRYLLLSALQELQRRGAHIAQIGAWRTNEAALNLYFSAGFTHHETTTYLAYNL